MASLFKWDMPSRVEAAKAKKQQAEAEERRVFRLVDARDTGHCRACGASCSHYDLSLLARAHRHHITYRSQLGRSVSENLVTLCPSCHSDVHAAKLAIEGNADMALTFSRRDADGAWFIARQEKEVGVYERD